MRHLKGEITQKAQTSRRMTFGANSQAVQAVQAVQAERTSIYTASMAQDKTDYHASGHRKAKTQRATRYEQAIGFVLALRDSLAALYSSRVPTPSDGGPGGLSTFGFGRLHGTLAKYTKYAPSKSVCVGIQILRATRPRVHRTPASSALPYLGTTGQRRSVWFVSLPPFPRDRRRTCGCSTVVLIGFT